MYIVVCEEKNIKMYPNPLQKSTSKISYYGQKISIYKNVTRKTNNESFKNPFQKSVEKNVSAREKRKGKMTNV